MSAGFDGALLVAMAEHLNVTPSDIANARVKYVEGYDDHDPTYGGVTHHDPKFEVVVTMADGAEYEADLEFTLTALLRMTLGLPQ